MHDEYQVGIFPSLLTLNNLINKSLNKKVLRSIHKPKRCHIAKMQENNDQGEETRNPDLRGTYLEHATLVVIHELSL